MARLRECSVCECRFARESAVLRIMGVLVGVTKAHVSDVVDGRALSCSMKQANSTQTSKLYMCSNCIGKVYFKVLSLLSSDGKSRA